jgi:D-sedoheptulose 7-phosphate isomerase
MGLTTLALLGKDGGKLKGMADFEYIIPSKTADKAQEIHMTILHIIIEGAERLLFPENYASR